MKLFQKLLVAPAALGLLAPLAANAAEVNINDVASYATPSAQATTSQFSDVVPGDWAYTALQNLSESYGCVDNAYTQNLKSGQALTRYEAAALVNACLDGGIASADVSADAARLSNEFGTEMAILKGRVDGLEYKVQELSAGQFSPTTKMRGQITFNTGYVDNDDSTSTNTKVHMQYDAKYDLYSSFTGRDSLYTRIRTGNESGPFGSTTSGTHLSKANSNSSLTVDKIWYQFPIGDDITGWVGPKIENYYMLASSPSIYKAVTKQFALGGNGSTYGSSTSPGFGFAWTQPTESRGDARFAVSTNYAAYKGNSPDPDTTSGSESGGGILTDTNSKWLSKIEYGSSKWQVSAAMAVNNCQNGTTTCKDWGGYYNTTRAGTVTGDQTSYALRAYWRPDSSGAVPSIQLGYDFSSIEDDGTAGETEKTSGYMVGLSWTDAFIDGNRAGIAFGSPEHATEQVAGGTADLTPFAWEAYYDYKVNDGITITPAIFGFTDRDGTNGAADDGFGGLVQTTFKF